MVFVVCCAVFVASGLLACLCLCIVSCLSCVVCRLLVVVCCLLLVVCWLLFVIVSRVMFRVC